MSFKEDEDIIRWKNNVSRGSNITAQVYFRRLRGFCNENQTSPQELVKLGKKEPKKLQDLLEDNVTRLDNEGKAGSYIKSILKSVRSWLSYNDIHLTRKIRISGANSTPTLENEKIPSTDELKQVINTANSRGRVTIALMSQSGLRPQTIGNGKDGLKIKDLPDLSIENGKVSLKNIPTQIIIRASVSKTGHKYLSFLSSEGCDYLVAYLQERIGRGENLNQESPLISFNAGGESKIFHKKTDNIHPSTKTVTTEIRKAIRSAGFNWRPYIFRAYFDTQLLLAESKGKITHSYRQFFMGHKGDMEARYTVNKGRLPESMIEDMRSSYGASENILMTNPRVESILDETKQAQLDMAKRLLSTIYPHLDLEITIKDRELEMNRALTVDESLDLILKTVGDHKNNRNEGENFRVIKVDELEDFLNKNPDWKPKQAVNSDKFLIERIS